MVHQSVMKMTKQDRTVLSSSHLDVYGAVLIIAHSSVADLAIATAGTIRPREVSSLADQLATGLPGAPQLGAGLHVWTGLGARAKGELTLAVQVVAGTRQVV